MLRDRTTIPRTIPRFCEIRKPGNSNAVVTMCGVTMFILLAGFDARVGVIGIQAEYVELRMFIHLCGSNGIEERGFMVEDEGAWENALDSKKIATNRLHQTYISVG